MYLVLNEIVFLFGLSIKKENCLVFKKKYIIFVLVLVMD